MQAALGPAAALFLGATTNSNSSSKDLSHCQPKEDLKKNFSPKHRIHQDVSSKVGLNQYSGIVCGGLFFCC